MQVKFLVLEGGNKGFDQDDTPVGFLRTANKQLVMLVGLEFRRPFTEVFADTFAQLQFRSSSRGVEIGETFSPQVLHLVEEFLELLDAARRLFD